MFCCSCHIRFLLNTTERLLHVASVLYVLYVIVSLVNRELMKIVRVQTFIVCHCYYCLFHQILLTLGYF